MAWTVPKNHAQGPLESRSTRAEERRQDLPSKNEQLRVERVRRSNLRGGRSRSTEQRKKKSDLFAKPFFHRKGESRASKRVWNITERTPMSAKFFLPGRKDLCVDAKPPHGWTARTFETVLQSSEEGTAMPRAIKERVRSPRHRRAERHVSGWGNRIYPDGTFPATLENQYSHRGKETRSSRTRL